MRLKNIYTYILLTGSLLLCSCIKEDYKGDGSGNGKVLLQVKATRSDVPDKDDGYIYGEIYEDKIDELHILLFDPVTGDFIEVVETEQYGLNEDGTNPIYAADVTLGTYHMVFLANCGELLEDSGVIDGDKEDFDDVRESLNVHCWDKWITDMTDNDFLFMPMWGEKASVTVDSNGADLRGPNLVPMVRMMAKVDIQLYNDGTLASLTETHSLQSVHVYNYRYSGQVIPDDGAVTFTPVSGDWEYSVNYPSLTNVTGFAKNTWPLEYIIDPTEIAYRSKIYLFETEAKDTDHPDEPLDYTCIVLGISNTKATGGATRGGTDPGGDPDGPPLGGGEGEDPIYHDVDPLYYRVDFTDNNGDYIPILRNHQYLITVKGIINKGFPDPGQAFRSGPFDIDYEVVWSDGFNGGIAPGTDNGTYRLDVSRTFVDMDINDDVISVSTTHPGGWSAYVSTSPDKIETTAGHWLMMKGAYDDYDYYPASSDKYTLAGLPAEKTFTLEIQADWPGVGGGQYKEAYIHIVSGNLTNVVTVRRWGWTEAR